MKLMLVGASGVVGQEVLRLALAHPGVERLIAPTRRPLAPADRLENPVVDFVRLPEDASWWQVDAVICTLGTTMALAGSQEAFRRVDYEHPLAVARLARAAGAQAFALVTALGANADARVFYSRVKGEIENAVRALAYPRLILVRPSLIEVGSRPDRRRGEGLALRAARILRPLIPPRYRPVKAEAIARTLLESVMAGRVGEQVIESQDIR